MSSWLDSNRPNIGVELSWRGFADSVDQAAIGRPRQRTVNARKPSETVDLENAAEVWGLPLLGCDAGASAAGLKKLH
jgi:hypothetical protein